MPVISEGEREVSVPLTWVHLAVDTCTTYPRYSSLDTKDLDRCDVMAYNKACFCSASEALKKPAPTRWDGLESTLAAVVSSMSAHPNNLCVPQLAGVLLENKDGQPVVFLRNTGLSSADEKSSARVAKMNLARVREQLFRAAEHMSMWNRVLALVW